MTPRLWLVALLVVGSPACGGAAGPARPPPSPAPITPQEQTEDALQPPAPQLAGDAGAPEAASSGIASAPTEIDEAGGTFRLSTEISHNRMPRSVGDPPSPLVVRVRLVAADGGNGPAVNVTRVWFVDGAGVLVEAQIADLGANRKARPGEHVLSASPGPGKSDDEAFDVVAEVSIAGGARRLLRAQGQRLRVLH